MASDIAIAWIVRWVHIVSAILALGGPFFVRFALLPVMGRVLDEEAQRKLGEAINARWKFAVHTLITLFILSGLYNFLVPTREAGVLITARWKDFDPADMRLYHMIFGIKMLAALGFFTIASGLVGRSAAFAPLRRQARRSITWLLVLGAIIVTCATLMHMLPLHPPGAP